MWGSKICDDGDKAREFRKRFIIQEAMGYGATPCDTENEGSGERPCLAGSLPDCRKFLSNFKHNRFEKLVWIICIFTSYVYIFS